MALYQTSLVLEIKKLLLSSHLIYNHTTTMQRDQVSWMLVVHHQNLALCRNTIRQEKGSIQSNSKARQPLQAIASNCNCASTTASQCNYASKHKANNCYSSWEVYTLPFGTETICSTITRFKQCHRYVVWFMTSY